MNARKLAAIIAESVERAAEPVDPELIDMPDLCHRLAISRATGFRLVKRGLLHPVRLPGVRATRYRLEEVLALAKKGGR